MGRDAKLGAGRVGCGNFLSETPEERLEVYRKLARSNLLHLLRNYFASHTVVAWKKEDRARIPSLWRAFVQELCDSTNPLTKVEGYFIAYADAKQNPEQELGARQLLFKVAVEKTDFDSVAAEGLLTDIDHRIPHTGDRDDTKLEQAFRADFIQAINVAWKKPIIAAVKAYVQTNILFNSTQFDAILYGKDKFHDYRFDESDANELLPTPDGL